MRIADMEKVIREAEGVLGTIEAREAVETLSVRIEEIEYELTVARPANWI